MQSGNETILQLPDHRRIIIPIPTADIFDYYYLPQTRMLYILGLRDWLSCRLSDQSEIKFYSLGELHEIPQYERIEASKEGVIIYQYGLVIGPNDGDPVIFDPGRFPYRAAAFLSDDTVIAVLENRAIHTIHTKAGIIDEITAPGGSIYFLSKLGNGAVMLWNDNNSDWGARRLWGARIVGRDWQQVCFGHVDAEAFTVVEEDETVYIGTLDSLTRWHVRRGLVETASMPEQERVVRLFWSEAMQKLFIGCRHGELFALQPYFP